MVAEIGNRTLASVDAADFDVISAGGSGEVHGDGGVGDAICFKSIAADTGLDDNDGDPGLGGIDTDLGIPGIGDDALVGADEVDCARMIGCGISGGRCSLSHRGNWGDEGRVRGKSGG